MTAPSMIRRVTSQNAATILSVSPFAEDHLALGDIIHQHLTQRWKLYAAASLDWGTNLLRLKQIPVVVCECDPEPGRTWRDFLEQTFAMKHHPLLIVTSRLADERLWAEALNLGAYDVLAKPFEQMEVRRVIGAAWHQWQDQHSGARHPSWKAAS